MPTTWWFFLIAAGLIVMSGFFSGLNLGLMSLAPDELKVVMEGSADEQAKRDAAKIYPLRKRGNLLLCTLLLGNTLVNALIAVLLADATDGVIGSLLTTALILIFGEIIPQSICSRYGLRTGAVALPFVYLFVGLCFVVCYPLSKILDWALGREITAVYTKNELKALLRMNLEDPARRGDFDEEDGRILAGALQFRDVFVDTAMTPVDGCFSLPETTVLDELTLQRILKCGHTRIPVMAESDETRVVGVLYAKDLVGIGFERQLSLKRVLGAFDAQKRVHEISTDTKLGAAFDICKQCRIHLLIVVDKTKRNWPMVGIITTEDIIEELIQDEIVGDDDEYVDDAKASTRRPGVVETNSKRYDPLALLRQLSREDPSERFDAPPSATLAPRPSLESRMSSI